jgi:TetR/AcrR family transcriptional repressor of nem operon
LVNPMPRPNVHDKLLAAAVKCFHAQGYQGTSIEDIADAAGVFKGSFYNHFRSKEALAVLVVGRYSDVFIASIALEGPPSAFQRLKNHFEWLAARNESTDFRHGCLMSNFSVEIYAAGKPLRRAVAEAFDRWFVGLAVLIRQAQDEGEIDRKQDPETLARFLANSWEGATIYSKVVRNRKPLDDFFAVTLSAVLRT